MHEHHEIYPKNMFFLPQGANIQSKSSKETNPIKFFWQKFSVPNPYNENPNQEYKTLQNIDRKSVV